MSSVNQSTIERAALGRMAALGDLYDARTDNFCGISVFNRSIPPSAITTIQNHSNNTEFLFDESLKEKSSRLGISADLTVSVAGGSIPLSASGSGKYLQEQKSSARSVRTTMMCDVKTVSEQLELFHTELKPFLSKEAMTHERATHVVVGIYWGGNAYLTLEFTDKADAEDLKIEASLHLAMQGAIVEIAANGTGNYSAQTKDIATHTKYSICGDVLPDAKDGPLIMSLKAACDQLSSFQKRIGQANGDKGKPVKYILFPLSDKALRNHLKITDVASVYRQIEETTLMSCVNLLDEITSVKQLVEDLVNDVNKYRNYLTPENVKYAKELKTNFERAETDLKAEIAKALKSIRSDDKADVTQLDEIKNRYLEKDYSHKNVEIKLYSDFTQSRIKMELARLCDKFGVKYVKGGMPMDEDITVNREVYVLYASDERMRSEGELWEDNRRAFFNIAKAIKSKKEKQKSSGDTTTVESLPFLIFRDCSSSKEEDMKYRITIRYFKNSIVVCEDELKRQNEILKKNIAKAAVISTTNLSTPDSQTKRIPVKMKCPGSIRGGCDSTPRQWECNRCHQGLHYDYYDKQFHCKCGSASVESFTYRCQDKVNHTMEDFIDYPKDELDKILLLWRDPSNSDRTLGYYFREEPARVAVQVIPPHKDSPVRRVLSFNDRLYATHPSYIAVYDIQSFKELERIQQNGMSQNGIVGLAACSVNNFLYFSDNHGHKVYRVELSAGNKITKIWEVQWPIGLSVNNVNNLIVTGHDSKIHEYKPNGTLVRTMPLSPEVSKPWQTIQLTSGQYIGKFLVAHGVDSDKLHRVSVVDDRGNAIACFGSTPGSGPGQLSWPCDVAVDRDDFIFLSERCNNRISMISPALSSPRQLSVPVERGLVFPLGLHLDKSRDLLFVGEDCPNGRVIVLRVPK